MSIFANTRSNWIDDFHCVRAPAEPEEPLKNAQTEQSDAAGPTEYVDLLSDFLKDLPALLPPSQYEDLTLALIRAQQGEVGIINYQIKDHCNRIDEQKSKKMALMAAQIQKIRENVEKSNQSNAWGMLGKVVTWLSSLFTIAMGGVVVGTGAGTGAGIAMILSGVAMLSTQLASEFGLFEKLAGELSGGDLKKKAVILQQLQLWTMLTTICLSVGSLASGYTALLSSGAMSAATSTVQGVLQVAGGTAAIGKSIAESGKLETEGDSKLYEGRLTVVSLQLKELLKDNEQKTKRWSSCTKLSTEIIKVDAEKRKAFDKLYGNEAAASA